MTFNPSNPLSHVGVRAKRPAEQYINQARDPTPNDWQNFVIGDEWRTKSTATWWKLCDNAEDIALWDKFAGPFSKLGELTAGDGTEVFPDVNNNITFVDGNGVNSTGDAPNHTITFNMNSPFTGDFTFQSITGGDPEVLTIQHTVNTATSNASVNIQVAGSAGQDAWVQTGVATAASYAMGIDTSTANDPWKLTFDAAGNATPSSAIVGATWDPITSIMTLPERVVIDVTDTTNTAATNALVLRHENSNVPGDDTGVAIQFEHEQADGTIVNGSRIYTKAPNAGTNVQSTDLWLQTNNAGSLDDQARLTSTGDFGAQAYSIRSLAGTPGIDYTDLFFNNSITVNADGDVNLISASNMQGILWIIWRTNLRDHYICLSIKYLQFSSRAIITVLGNFCSVTPEVLTNFRFYSDATNNGGTLVCAVQNRNGGTGPLIVTYYSQGDWDDVVLLPGSATLTTELPIQGMWQQSNTDSVLMGWVKNANTTSADEGFGVYHETYAAAGNNIGVAFDFFHKQADGTVVDGIKLYSQAPNASTNVQTSNLYFQCNVAGVLTDRMRLESDGKCYANQFVSPFTAVTADPSSDAFFYAETSGADSAYLEIDMGNSSGYGGIRMQNAGGATQDWEIHAHGTSPNTLDIDYQDISIIRFSSNRTTLFFGTTSNPAPEITAQARVATADATLTTIYTITLDTNEMVQTWVEIQGTRTDYSASLFGTINSGARRAGAGAILIGTPVINYQEDSAGAPIISSAVSGNDLLIQVQGVAAENWVWMATIRYSIITE